MSPHSPHPPHGTGSAAMLFDPAPGEGAGVTAAAGATGPRGGAIPADLNSQRPDASSYDKLLSGSDADVLSDDDAWSRHNTNREREMTSGYVSRLGLIVEYQPCAPHTRRILYICHARLNAHGVLIHEFENSDPEN